MTIRRNFKNFVVFQRYLTFGNLRVSLIISDVSILVKLRYELYVVLCIHQEKGQVV